MTTSVTLSRGQYIDLLIKSGVFDAAQWPEDARPGAEALARVRQIEADCVATHGAFDWERLDSAVQDEYDGLTGVLDQLRYEDDGADDMSWEEYQQSRRARGLEVCFS